MNKTYQENLSYFGKAIKESESKILIRILEMEKSTKWIQQLSIAHNVHVVAEQSNSKQTINDISLPKSIVSSASSHIISFRFSSHSTDMKINSRSIKLTIQVD
ncbi:hypothetical protein CDAR_293801 [Caerostris darwini]|uniref:Uncharacterized protein n=1 Tax=Caerostris darwini TaxID=1538125 RepID=A0AAV4VFW2_9ARAC|nr:hypothetical protein CDAR_293801 [Caerostris darwini]